MEDFEFLTNSLAMVQNIRPCKKMAGVRVELYPEVPRAPYQGKLKSFVNPSGDES